MLKREIIGTALLKLYPDGGWGVDDSTKKFSDIYWASKAPITEAEFLKHYKDAELAYELEIIRAGRSKEYPSIGDQLDDLFKAGMFSESMAAKIQAIKDKYPKP